MQIALEAYLIIDDPIATEGIGNAIKGLIEKVVRGASKAFDFIVRLISQFLPKFSQKKPQPAEPSASTPRPESKPRVEFYHIASQTEHTVSKALGRAQLVASDMVKLATSITSETSRTETVSLRGGITGTKHEFEGSIENSEVWTHNREFKDAIKAIKSIPVEERVLTPEGRNKSIQTLEDCKSRAEKSRDAIERYYAKNQSTENEVDKRNIEDLQSLIKVVNAFSNNFSECLALLATVTICDV